MATPSVHHGTDGGTDTKHTMNESPITLRVEAGVAVATLSDPDRMNRFGTSMRNALVEILDTVAVHPDVRAFVLAASGPHFCVGGDVSEFGNAPSIFEARRIRWLVDPWLRLWNLPVPTIVALKGHTLGSGFEMAMYCDLRVADHTLSIGLPELRIGMLPAAGGTQTLARFTSPDQAMYLACRDQPLTAAQALAHNLVHELADDADERAGQLARSLASLPPHAAQAARQATRTAIDAPLTVGLTAEKRWARLVAATEHS